MKPSDVRGLIDRAMTGMRAALRGKWKKVSNDRVMLVQAEGLNGEQFEGMEWFQQPGFRSRPSDKGAEIIIVPLHGKSAHGIVIASANGKLFVTEMEDGETALFNEKEGHFIHLKNNKIIQMECDTFNLIAKEQINFETKVLVSKATESTKIDSPTTEATGAVTTDGLLTFQAGLTGQGAAGGGAAVNITGSVAMHDGNFNLTGGDVNADGISLKTHKTSGIQLGTDTGGSPST